MAGRGVYWNIGYSNLLSAGSIRPEEISFFETYGIERVHIWINDQPTTGYHRGLRYAGGWNRQRLDAVIPLLQARSIKVVLIVSPGFATRESLDGLIEPFKIAASHPGVDLELDMEANITDGYGQSTGTDALMTAAEAHNYILGLLETHAPLVKFGVSSNLTYYPKHRKLIERAAWLSPQFYGPDQAKWDNWLTRPYFSGRPIWLGISCISWGSQKIAPEAFRANLAKTVSLAQNDPVRFPALVIWSRFALQDDGPYLGGAVTVASSPYREILRLP